MKRLHVLRGRRARDGRAEVSNGLGLLYTIEFCFSVWRTGDLEGGQPKHWGQEEAKILLDGEAITPAISQGNQLVTVGIANDIQIFCMDTKERANVLHGHPGEVVTVAFAPCLRRGAINNQDAPRYLLASQTEEEGGVGGRIILWELDQYGRNIVPRTRRNKLVLQTMKTPAPCTVFQASLVHSKV